ncbi:hypothetical protein D5086_022939 [Populus alba]|uniref:Uncharacterized protein n=1 Tax=Populus alba TaxID=43335 RepID=A0ACC4B8E0_POPAL
MQTQRRATPMGFMVMVGPSIYPAREIVQSATLRGLVFVENKLTLVGMGRRLDSSLPREIFDLSKLARGTYGTPGCYWSKFCGYFRNRSLLLELYEVNIKNFVHSEITSMKSSIYKPSSPRPTLPSSSIHTKTKVMQMKVGPTRKGLLSKGDKGCKVQRPRCKGGLPSTSTSTHTKTKVMQMKVGPTSKGLPSKDDKRCSGTKVTRGAKCKDQGDTHTKTKVVQMKMGPTRKGLPSKGDKGCKVQGPRCYALGPR